MGPPCSRSRALPWGTPSATSMRTTSPSCFWAASKAMVPPICPAPTSEILVRFAIVGLSWLRATSRSPLLLLGRGYPALTRWGAQQCAPTAVDARLPPGRHRLNHLATDVGSGLGHQHARVTQGLDLRLGGTGGSVHDG